MRCPSCGLLLAPGEAACGVCGFGTKPELRGLPAVVKPAKHQAHGPVAVAECVSESKKPVPLVLCILILFSPVFGLLCRSGRGLKAVGLMALNLVLLALAVYSAAYFAGAIFGGLAVFVHGLCFHLLIKPGLEKSRCQLSPSVTMGICVAIVFVIGYLPALLLVSGRISMARVQRDLPEFGVSRGDAVVVSLHPAGLRTGDIVLYNNFWYEVVAGPGDSVEFDGKEFHVNSAAVSLNNLGEFRNILAQSAVGPLGHDRYLILPFVSYVSVQYKERVMLDRYVIDRENMTGKLIMRWFPLPPGKGLSLDRVQ